MISTRLLAMDQQIRDLIAKRGNRPMTEAELLQQSYSFIVGNSFDIFRDAQTITPATILASRQQLLNLGYANNGAD